MPRIRTAPVIPEEAPGLAAGSSSDSAVSPGSKAAAVWQPVKEGQTKDMYILTLQVVLGKISFTILTITSWSVPSCIQVTVAGGGDEPGVMSVPSAVTPVNGSRLCVRYPSSQVLPVSAALSPHRRYLASGGRHRVLRLWQQQRDGNTQGTQRGCSYSFSLPR